jgi:hypothetical protein
MGVEGHRSFKAATFSRLKVCYFSTHVAQKCWISTARKCASCIWIRPFSGSFALLLWEKKIEETREKRSRKNRKNKRKKKKKTEEKREKKTRGLFATSFLLFSYCKYCSLLRLKSLFQVEVFWYIWKQE